MKLDHPRRVLITGATGFVGDRLRRRLQGSECEVVCSTRSRARVLRWVRSREVSSKERWVRMDVNLPETVRHALEGCDAAVYLVHGMGDDSDYERHESEAAMGFVRAAESAGVRRIVYLGGVAPSGPPSSHLRSRLRTGEILRSGGVNTVELRAGMIVGHGGESWQMVRDLSARLPFMVLPRWLKSESQPVAVKDVLAALVRALDPEPWLTGCWSLPGPETMSAKEILLRVSRLRGYRPLTFDVPLVSPRLSSHWIAWVTRAEPRIARELVEGLRSHLVATEPSFWQHLPTQCLQSFDEAARCAMREETQSHGNRGRKIEALVQRLAPRA